MVEVRTGEPLAEEFYDTELVPVLAELDGPVTGFVLDKESDLAAKSIAIETGEIARGTFANLAIFDNSPDSLTRERRRYQAKTGGGVLRILMESDAEIGITDKRALALEKSAAMHVQQEVNHAVVVEAARKLHIEGTAEPRHARMYKQELDRAQSELYPEVEAEVVNSILSTLGGQLRAVDPVDLPADQHSFLESFKHDNPHVMERRHETGPQPPEIPQERVEEFQQELRKRFQPAMDKVREEIGGELTQADMARAMNIFMREIGMPMAESEDDHRGWLCLPDESFAGYKTVPARRRMYAGRFSEPNWERFEELAIHEAVVHALRSENGAKTGVAALRVGLTGNAMVEEGLGILAEQLWRGKIKTELGRDEFRYIAVAYADGKVDGKPHTETETLRFVSSFMAAANIASGTKLDAENLLKKKRSLAYDHVKRAYRGMPPGSVLRSNLSYKRGKVDAIQLIADHSAPAAEVLDYLLQGKFNPLNDQHKEVLAALDMQANIT